MQGLGHELPLDTFTAYQKALRENYNSSINIARLEHGSTTQATEDFTLMSNALKSAWRYSVLTNDMQAVRQRRGTLKQVKLPPENHVWIDLSSSLPLGYYPSSAFGNEVGYRISRVPIGAMWFYCPDLERLRLNQPISTHPGRWILALINPYSGVEHDAFFYDTSHAKWSRRSGINERHHEVNKHLNTWRNRLREALFLIQQNAYRPSTIS